MVSMPMSGISNLHVTKTAREILFDGYKDGILSTLRLFPGLSVPNKFGYFYGVSIVSVQCVRAK